MKNIPHNVTLVVFVVEYDIPHNANYIMLCGLLVTSQSCFLSGNIEYIPQCYFSSLCGKVGYIPQ